ncbi:hypothetical protein LPJ55_003159 [Coemansia sp. RSA 990]|nr:hypothetical protein BX667DRAFT_494272 [Coemansia mojavensis]KAJ1872390.1 hypothetical protein LPJ55_003159 [Coemansia sp. RSA 990]
MFRLTVNLWTRLPAIRNHRVAAYSKHTAAVQDKVKPASDTEDIWIKRRPLPKTTSIEYTIPEDPYLLAQKFTQVVANGKPDDAVAIVMQSKTRSQSTAVWNLVIREYAKNGRLSRALRAHTEMRKRGFEATNTTYTELLKACALSDSDKSTAMAENLYKQLTNKLEPTIINFNTLLTVYLRKHDLTTLLDRFNNLPANGSMAPELATFTIVFSAFRREIFRKLQELKQVGVEEKDSESQVFGKKRRLALIATNIRSVYEAMLDLWKVFVNDAERRLQCPDTKALELDAHMVKIILKTCLAIYHKNRALGRKGLQVIETAYGMDETLDTDQPGRSKVPLAARLCSQDSAHSSVLDNEVIELAFALCARDNQPIKALRFWSSLERHFAAELEPLKQQHKQALDEFRSKASKWVTKNKVSFT